jgi:hypothetical protein
MAGPMFDRAATAAYSAQQQVAYRDARARWAHETRDLASEVRLYQEILANPQWRKVNIAREGGSSPAWSVAEKTIIDLVRSRRDLYASYEQEAAAALAALKGAASAGQAVDAEKFMEIAERYPVASVSPEALFGAASAYEAAGKNRQATQVLNQILRKNFPVDRARLLEAQARNYLAVPNAVGSAIGRLMEGAKMGDQQLRQPLKLPDGRILQGISFKAAALTLQAYSAQVANAMLPDFKLPQGGLGKPFLPEAPETIIDEVDQLLVPPREQRPGSRHDRVATWTVGRGVSLYGLGQAKPLGTNPAVNEAPRGVAWAGKDLVVWTPSKLLLLSGEDAKTKWETPLKNLPAAELVNDDPAEEGSPNIGRGQMRAVANAMGRAAAAGGVESIDRVRPLADRVIIGTSTGRVAAFEMANGQLAWQTRVAEAPLDRLTATDDFVAVQQADDLGAQIVAIEALNGQVVYRKIFVPSGGEQPALNMALAADGTLVWSLTDRVCGKDLYDSTRNLKFGKFSLADNGQMFNGAIGDEQLIVADGRILAISDSAQYLRVLLLDSGRQDNTVRSPLATQSPQNNWNVYLRVIGPRLYVVNTRNVLGYNLNNPDDTWPGYTDTKWGVMRDSFFGRDHIVLMLQVIDANAAPVPSAGRYRLVAYSRAINPDSGKESGYLDVSEPVTHPAGIDQWQGVEGGFYYRSLDRKLHFLRGAAK